MTNRMTSQKLDPNCLQLPCLMHFVFKASDNGFALEVPAGQSSLDDFAPHLETIHQNVHCVALWWTVEKSSECKTVLSERQPSPSLIP